MKNIAILSSCLTRGGAEHAAGELSVQMSKYSNIYLFLLEKKPITYDYKGKIIQLKFEEYYAELRKKPLGVLWSKYAYIKVIKDIKNLKRKYKIDSCVSFLEILNMMNLMSRGEEKVFLSVRNNRSMQNDTKLNRFENWFIKHLYKNADGVVSVAYGVEEDLKVNFRIPARKLTTIYNYYDVEGFKNKSCEDLPDHVRTIIAGKRVLLSMGRYVEQKCFIQLIDLIKPIVNSYNDTILIILGRGPLKDRMEQKIKRENLQNKVYLIDYLDNPFPLIKAADIFIMNSKFEGICNSIVEAMICGTLTVSTDCKYGPREMMNDEKSYRNNIEHFMVCKRGILVPVGDSNEMQKAISYALEHREELQTCIENGKSFFNESFNSTVDNQWKKLLGTEL